jgi:hypothetical protein
MLSKQRTELEDIMLDRTHSERKEAVGGDSDKRKKFVELAERRTKTAIKAIRTIAKLGNRHAYNYTEADVKRIAGALSHEVDALKSRMLSTNGKEAVDFKL